MRATLGVTAFAQAEIYLSGGFGTTGWNWIFGLLAIVGGTMLFVGFLTSLSGFLMLAWAIFAAASQISSGAADGGAAQFNFSSVYVGIIAFSVALLGPGAFSLDARFFGRREIIIPDDSPLPHR